MEDDFDSKARKKWRDGDISGERSTFQRFNTGGQKKLSKVSEKKRIEMLVSFDTLMKMIQQN